MNNLNYAREEYVQALKLGRKTHKESVHQGKYPYLQVLDDILSEGMVSGQTDLGIMEIPINRIVGTKSQGRTNSFANNFMPLLSEDSEFAHKWQSLCAAHLGDEGIREAVRCYEYLGRFYVEEGNKRVSVLKHFGAVSIPGHVIRILPVESEDEKIQRYYEFLDNYKYTGLYQIYFTQANSFSKLQIALGHDTEYIWTAEDRRHFLSGLYYFEEAFKTLGGAGLSISSVDALLVWLKVYNFEQIREMTSAQLIKSMQAVWADVKLLEKNEPISVSTEAEDDPERKSIAKRVLSLIPSTLKIAFISELTPEESNWVKGHELGRLHLEETIGDLINTQVVFGVGTGEKAEAAIEKCIANGAELIFTTTVSLISVCRKMAAKYPNIKFLNCSISMPYTGVRTYYSRIYEGKFISGAIAGAISRSNEIGYIASYPIFGVPASINAFAMGALMTNPNARIKLKWSCVSGDPLAELKSQGIDIVSTLDIPMPGWDKGLWGLFKINDDGSTNLLASPYWDWGTFYVKLVKQFLDGSWDIKSTSKQDNRQAVNYWWGISSGVIGLEFTDALPSGVKRLANLIKNDISRQELFPFADTICPRDGEGNTIDGSEFSPTDILHMDWLCSNIDGSIPGFEELTDKAKAIVRLQGIYRDSIPPEKEGVIL